MFFLKSLAITFFVLTMVVFSPLPIMSMDNTMIPTVDGQAQQSSIHGTMQQKMAVLRKKTACCAARNTLLLDQPLGAKNNKTDDENDKRFCVICHEVHTRGYHMQEKNSFCCQHKFYQECLRYYLNSQQASGVKRCPCCHAFPLGMSTHSIFLELLEDDQTDQAIKMITEPSFDVNFRYDDGCTPLIYAAEFGFSDVVRALLNVKGIRINDTDDDGYAAIMYACCCDRSIPAMRAECDLIASLLVEAGAKVEIKGKTGNEAFIYVVQKGFLGFVKALLKDKNIDVNSKDKHGSPALLVAAQNGHYSIVKALLKDPRVNVNSTNKNGKTALQVLKERKSDQIIQSLRDHGAIE